MSLILYRGIVMPLSYYPGMEDHTDTNQLRSISPTVLLADNGISMPPPFPDKRRMIRPRPPFAEETDRNMEKNGSNIGEL